jgi:hypothetical protein
MIIFYLSSYESKKSQPYYLISNLHAERKPCTWVDCLRMVVKFIVQEQLFAFAKIHPLPSEPDKSLKEPMQHFDPFRPK